MRTEPATPTATPAVHPGHDHQHAHDDLDATDPAGLLHEMNHRLSALGRRLSPEQWVAPSLCEGWRSCDVFGHMAYGGGTPLHRVVPALLVRYRANLTKGSKFESIRLADAHSQAALMDRFDAAAARPVGFGKLIKPSDQVVDHVIHELDIRRPLGVPGALDHPILVGALNALGGAKSKLFSPATTIAGLRLQATDVDWCGGPADGPTVVGPAEDLLLAAGGRRVGLDSLTGTGVDELSRRTLRG